MAGAETAPKSLVYSRPGHRWNRQLEELVARGSGTALRILLPDLLAGHSLPPNPPAIWRSSSIRLGSLSHAPLLDGRAERCSRLPFLNGLHHCVGCPSLLRSLLHMSIENNSTKCLDYASGFGQPTELDVAPAVRVGSSLRSASSPGLR